MKYNSISQSSSSHLCERTGDLTKHFISAPVMIPNLSLRYQVQENCSQLPHTKSAVSIRPMSENLSRQETKPHMGSATRSIKERSTPDLELSTVQASSMAWSRLLAQSTNLVSGVLPPIGLLAVAEQTRAITSR